MQVGVAGGVRLQFAGNGARFHLRNDQSHRAGVFVVCNRFTIILVLSGVSYKLWSLRINVFSALDQGLLRIVSWSFLSQFTSCSHVSTMVRL